MSSSSSEDVETISLPAVTDRKSETFVTYHYYQLQQPQQQSQPDVNGVKEEDNHPNWDMDDDEEEEDRDPNEIRRSAATVTIVSNPAECKCKCSQKKEEKAGISKTVQIFVIALLLLLLAVVIAFGTHGIHTNDEFEEKVMSEIAALRIPGQVVAFAGNVVPDGWLLCDGRELSQSEYPRLHRVLQDTYGSGAANDTFKLPDYRGLFLRGVNGDRNDELADPDVDSRGNVLGSVQADAVRSHAHAVTSFWGNEQAVAVGKGWSVVQIDPKLRQDVRDTAATGGSETRPKNIYVHYIICMGSQ